MCWIHEKRGWKFHDIFLWFKDRLLKIKGQNIARLYGMTHDDDFRYEYLSEVGTLFKNKNIEKVFRCSHVPIFLPV